MKKINLYSIGILALLIVLITSLSLHEEANHNTSDGLKEISLQGATDDLAFRYENVLMVS